MISHPGVAKSLRFMWEHCDKPISVDELAGMAGMSMRSFYQAFTEHVRRPPGEELHRIRIERAKKLLAESNDKIDVIAQQCGYQSGNSFWVAFKQATGISPRQYQKQTVLMPNRQG
jgi:LacI family transcriptional regulator